MGGDPGGVRSAARDLGRAGASLDSAAEEVGSSGRSVTNEWRGTAADAAGEVIGTLRNQGVTIADAVAECQPIYERYADELAAAQRALTDASARLVSAEAGQRAGATAAMRADDAAVTDLSRAAAVSAAADASARATALAGEARLDIERAVEQEATANESAARQIDAICERIEGVDIHEPGGGVLGDGTTRRSPMAVERAGLPADEPVVGFSSLPGPGESDRPTSVPQGDDVAEMGQWWYDIVLGKTPEDEANNRHSVTYNQVGGLGDGAWKAVPGLLGGGLEKIPWAPAQRAGEGISGVRDTLERWYGADTSSEAYRENTESGDLAFGMMVPLPVGKGKLVVGATEEVLEAGAGTAAKKAMPEVVAVEPMSEELAERALAESLKPQVVDHIMHKPRHQLNFLQNKFGTEEKTVEAITRSLGNDLPAEGERFEMVRQIEGYDVTIRGRVVNGTPRIGTAFIP